MITERKQIRTATFPALSWQEGGDGMPMVLIHGFPENGDLWQPVVTKLSEAFRLIIPDLPGAGQSSRPADRPLTVELMADSIREIMDAAAVDTAVIAGHSMGGYTAFAFAAQYPDRVQGLSLVHSLANADDEEKKEARRKSVTLIRKGGKEIFVRQMIPGLFSESFRKEQPEVVSTQLARALQLPDEDMIAFYEAIAARTARMEVLQDARFPVQWIIGQEDKATPAEKALQQAGLSDVSFVQVYAECAHMSMLEQPERLAGDLTEFGLYCQNR
jgi:pimeloyl-ACP methyl ester carboxylesterase